MFTFVVGHVTKRQTDDNYKGSHCNANAENDWWMNHPTVCGWCRRCTTSIITGITHIFIAVDIIGRNRWACWAVGYGGWDGAGRGSGGCCRFGTTANRTSGDWICIETITTMNITILVTNTILAVAKIAFRTTLACFFDLFLATNCLAHARTASNVALLATFAMRTIVIVPRFVHQEMALQCCRITAWPMTAAYVCRTTVSGHIWVGLHQYFRFVWFTFDIFACGIIAFAAINRYFCATNCSSLPFCRLVFDQCAKIVCFQFASPSSLFIEIAWCDSNWFPLARLNGSFPFCTC